MSRYAKTPDVTEFVKCPYCNKDIGVIRSKHNCKQYLQHLAYVWPLAMIALRWTPAKGWCGYGMLTDNLLYELEFHEVFNLVTQYPDHFKPEDV